MVSKNIIKVFLIIIVGVFSVCAQENNRISSRKNELSKIKDEIVSLQNRLKLKTRKERESYNVLENYNKQNYLLRKLISSLKSEERLKESQISVNEKKTQTLKKDITRLKDNYSKYVVSVYKHGPLDDWVSLLDAASFEQALLRFKYMKRFSERRLKDLQLLKEKKDSLNAVTNRLEKEKQEKILLTGQKQEEQKNLNEKREDRKRILRAIRNDKTALISEIKAKKDAESRIQNLINKLIEEAERKRKEEDARLAAERAKAKNNNKIITSNNTTESRTNEGYDVDLSTAGFSSFSVLKGRLNWPVSKGRIVKKFGENRNSRLNTVTLNYGVDIKTSSDEKVIAVADGVVSAIDWLPGYGSVIIITHKGDYRTVYSHLSDIYVREGDKVKLGTVIGKVGESIEGNVLHFEIWNSREKQNPEKWLAGR